MYVYVCKQIASVHASGEITARYVRERLRGINVFVMGRILSGNSDCNRCVCCVIMLLGS